MDLLWWSLEAEGLLLFTYIIIVPLDEIVEHMP